MKKIFFLGHRYHQRTKSFKFFTDILEKHYSVDFYWVDLEYKNIELGLLDVKKENYSAYIFFQIIPNPDFINTLTSDNVILIPMYESAMFYDYKKWLQYKNYKLINFSKTLHNKLSTIGFNSLYLQYFPAVPLVSRVTKIKDKKYKVFFWQRGHILDWNKVQKLLPSDKIHSVHIHRVEKDIIKDTWARKYTKEDVSEYNMTFSSWFEKREEFQDKLNECDIFIAPRLFEGIGMTFLEAMSLGKCVISPDFPTMNEYITHNQTGLLFDIDNLQKLDLENVYKIGENAQKYIQNGYIQWKNQTNKLIDFIEKTNMYNVESKYIDSIASVNSISPLTHEQRKNLDLVSKYSNLVFEDIKLQAFEKNIHTQESESYVFSKNINLLYQLLDTLEDDTIIYGAGALTKIIIPYLKNKISYIVDLDEKLWGKNICGIEIRDPNNIAFDADKKIFITVLGREIDIYRYLLIDLKVSSENIIIFKPKDFKPL